MHGGATERVLVVDDEPQILLALEDLLGDDFTILKSETPERALALMAEDPSIAVVITDQRMPRMLGDELLTHLGDSSRVGIMISGVADLPAVIRAINDGRVFAYVAKPWNDEDLRFKVAKGVEHFRQARQVARERQLLADLMNSSPDAIFFKAKDLTFQRMNRSFAQVLGITSPEAAIGRKLSDGLIAADLAATIEAEEELLLRSGEPSLDVVREYQSKGGTSAWYSESKAPIRDREGKVEGLVAIARNVSERLRAQEALRTSEEQLRQQGLILSSILDGIGEGVIVVDSFGHTLVFNSEAERVLGTRARDAPPEQFARTYGVYLADGRTLVPDSENPLLRAMHGSPREEMEAIVKNGDAPAKRVALVATPLRNDNGEVTGAIVLLRDVTETRNLEQLLVQSQKMEAVGQLAGGIAHDFNNLLAVIEGCGELALEELTGHVARADVLEMVSASKRAASLTRQLLAFSRREPPQLKPVALADVVRNVERMLRRLIGENITLLTRLEPGAGLITGDSNQLEHVLINLCINARDAMPEGGTLSIDLRSLSPEAPAALPGRRSLALSVSDTGAGIDPALLNASLTRFLRPRRSARAPGLACRWPTASLPKWAGRFRWRAGSDAAPPSRWCFPSPVTNALSLVIPSSRQRSRLLASASYSSRMNLPCATSRPVSYGAKATWCSRHHCRVKRSP